MDCRDGLEKIQQKETKGTKNLCEDVRIGIPVGTLIGTIATTFTRTSPQPFFKVPRFIPKGGLNSSY
jgi:hypothetical protein